MRANSSWRGFNNPGIALLFYQIIKRVAGIRGHFQLPTDS